MNPQITLCVPTYNSNYLDRLFDSLLAQTFRSFKVVVVDDCSTDSTWERLKDLQSRSLLNIELRRHSQNSGGMGLAVQETLAACSTPFYSWMGSDDELHPTYLESLHRKLTEENLDYTYSNFEIIDEHSRPKDSWTWRTIGYRDLVRHVASTLSGCLPMNGLLRCAFIRENDLNFILYRGENFSCDTVNAMHFLRAGLRCGIVPQNLFRYRVHKSQESKLFERRILSDLKVLEYIVAYHFSALDNPEDSAVEYYRKAACNALRQSFRRFSDRESEVRTFIETETYKKALAESVNTVAYNYEVSSK